MYTRDIPAIDIFYITNCHAHFMHLNNDRKFVKVDEKLSKYFRIVVTFSRGRDFRSVYFAFSQLRTSHFRAELSDFLRTFFGYLQCFCKKQRLSY